MTVSDEGLASERTGLAWSRTSLAFLANGGLLLLRHLRDGGSAVHLGLAAASFALAALVVVFGRVRARQVRAGGASPPGPSVALVTTLGVSVGVFAVLVTVGIFEI